MKLQGRLPLSDTRANEIIDLRATPDNFDKLINMKHLICGESGPEKAFSMREFGVLKEKVLHCSLTKIVELKVQINTRPKNLGMLRFKLMDLHVMIKMAIQDKYPETELDYKNAWKQTAKSGA